MSLEQIRSVVTTLERDIANGPIVPTVTPEEIRNHLARYNFENPMPLEEVTRDVEQMMRPGRSRSPIRDISGCSIRA